MASAIASPSTLKCKKMRSLSFKLTLAFLTVAVLGAVLVAVMVNWQTQRQFDAFINELYQEDLTTLRDQLADYYQEHGSWDGVETIFLTEQLPAPNNDNPPNFDEPPDFDAANGFPSRRLPIVLVNNEQEVIFGSRRYQPGDPLPANVIERGQPVEVDGETVGWIIIESFGNVDFADSPEARFLNNLNRLTVWSAIVAGSIALLLGIWLARTISHPVSELKEATEQVAQGKLGAQVSVKSKDEIGQLAASFNQMSTDLARSNQLRRQMTADIAHDLRTPLSVLQGYTEALDDGKLHGEPDIYHAMHKQTIHLNRLVEDLRTLSLADAGQLSLHPQAVAPRDLLEHTVLIYAPQAERQHITLHLDIADDLPHIFVDLDRMVQVLGNLISNALRHTAAGGEIRLAAESQNQHLLLQVHDSGAGIAPEDLPHVFDRFYRGDKARSESGESGLGLAISRSIVEAHNGRISATSTPGQGTTFTITLPVHNQ